MARGQDGFAIPFLYDSFIHDFTPVYPDAIQVANLPRKAAGRKPTAIGLEDYEQVAAGRLTIGRRLPTCPTSRQAANDDRIPPAL
jgi:hypothetical protein